MTKEHRQLARLPKIVGGRRRLSVEDHRLRCTPGHQLNALSVYVSEDVSDRTTIFARLRHRRGKRLAHIGRVSATLRERLGVTLAPNAALIAGSGVHGRAA